MSFLDIDPNVYLGNDYNTWKNLVNSCALSKTDSYFTMKTEVSNDLKKAMVRNIFNIIKNALREGKKTNPDGTPGNTLFTLAPLLGKAVNYPPQLIEKEALDASKTIDTLLDRIVSIIFPKEIDEIFKATAVREGHKDLLTT
jgi:hypothetical protein